MAFDTVVFAYSCMNDALALLPSAYSANIRNPRQRVQLEEIDKILSKVNAKTVVAEEYIDRHFIHDFCAHYGSCYFDYPKKCIRLHFFANKFSQDQFKQYVTSGAPDSDGLGNYCGFIVLRPIPGAILGNVSLAVAMDPNKSFCIRKKRGVHLCGMELVVETIPFQEQDHAISACATTALWMALHAVPGNQSHNVPSPYRLTENAHKVMVDVMRSHEVTRGLTISQMANAIKEENLNPLTCVPLSTSYIKALVKAYLNMSVPVVFGIELYYRSDSSAQGVSSRRIGYHSVTALGYAWGTQLKLSIHPICYLLTVRMRLTCICNPRRLMPFFAIMTR